MVVLFRPAMIFHIQGPRAGAASHVDQSGDDFFRKIFEKYGIAIFSGLDLMTEPDIPATAVIGISPGEYIHIRIYGHIIYVSQTMRIYFHLRTVRTNPQDTSPQHG
jgi:hypothetical protein